MARAKDTSRSEARKRTRDLNRAELAAEQEPEDGGEPAATTATSTRPRRPSLFTFPDVRADLKALPEMFRTRKLLWLPFGLLLIGFVLAMAFNVIPAEYQQWTLLYFQYFFAPQALFTYFIGGFVATRASYLVGTILGAVTGVLWTIVLAANTLSAPGDSGLPTGSDLASTAGTVLVASIVLGMFAGGFAGWYRDFLRGMQNRSKERQAQQQQQAKAKRAADRQEARRAAKARPTN